MSDTDSSDAELESADYDSSEIDTSGNEVGISDEDNSRTEVESAGKKVNTSAKENKKPNAKDTVRELRELIDRFKAALCQIGVGNDKSNYVVKGVAKFHAVINTCTSQFLPKLLSILHLPESKDPNKVVLPSPKNRTWQSVRSVVKSYLTALIQLLSNVASIELKERALKRMHEIVVFYACFADLSKVAMRKMIDLWSSEEETLRVVALRCIIRLVLHTPDKLVEPSFKRMYLAYRSNCKFTTVKSLPFINYMKQSLVEILALRPHLAFKCVNLGKKALAAELRDVLHGHKHTKGKKLEKGGGKKQKREKQENIPAVFNWQFLHSLALWTTLACHMKSHELVQKELIPDLINIVNGMLMVNPSARYYPVTFFCVRLLIQLCETFEGKRFVQAVHPLTRILSSCSLLLRNPKQTSMKMCNFDVALRMSKSEVREKAYLDGVIEQIFELMLQYSVCFDHRIGFNGVVAIPICRIKEFIKKCRVRTYTSKMKILVQKLEEGADRMRKYSRAAGFDKRDELAREAYEERIKQEKSPLSVFFENWKKKHLEKKEMLFSDKEKIEKKAEIKSWKERGPKTATADEREMYPDLFKEFDSDEDDDDDDKPVQDDEKSDEDLTDENDDTEDEEDLTEGDITEDDDSEDENSSDKEALKFKALKRKKRCNSSENKDDNLPKKKRMKFR